MTKTRKTIAAFLAALTVAGALTAAAGPAEAGPRQRRDWNGGAVAAGIVGGIALGALAASAANAAPLAPPPPAGPYYAPQPGPYHPAYPPGPVPACGWTREPVYDRFGDFAGWRKIPLC